MDIQTTLRQLDSLFQQKEPKKAEEFLSSALEQAMKEKDDSAVVTLLNEIIGFYRESSQYAKSMAYGKRLLALLKQMGLEDSLPYATSLLNLANACRAAGELETSLSHYHTRAISELLTKDDFRFASLYNNMSLLYQEKKDYKNACLCLTEALAIVKQYPEAVMEEAATHINMAASLMELDELEQAHVHLQEASALFREYGTDDYHYGFSSPHLGGF